MKLPINESGLQASQLIYGCMGLGGGWTQDAIQPEHIKQAHEVVELALEIGINMFDHADIYTFGKAETVFGQVLKEKPALREKMIIQSKLGIRFPDEKKGIPARYDFSKSYILESVDGIITFFCSFYFFWLSGLYSTCRCFFVSVANISLATSCQTQQKKNRCN
jgi:predicted oxidoreductase